MADASISSLSNTSQRDLIVAEARGWIGTPYRHQASVRGIGCDCIGLVRGLWRRLYGEEAEATPAYSSDWAETSGEETLIAAATRHMDAGTIAGMMPGDLLVFRWRPHLPAKHVGVLVEASRMVHAYQGAGRVCEGELVAAWRARIAAVFAFPEII